MVSVTDSERIVKGLLKKAETAFDLDGFLRNIIDFGGQLLSDQQVVFDGGSAFLLDRATNTLQLAFDSEGRDLPRRLRRDQGVAGAAYHAGEGSIYSGETLTQHFIQPGVAPFAICAIPVTICQEPYAVFCFDLQPAGDTPQPAAGPGRQANPSAPSSIVIGQHQRQTCALLEQALNSSSMRSALHRILRYQLRNDIDKAGTAVLSLPARVSRFLIAFREAFERHGVPSPDALSLQLIDPPANIMRTIQADGGLPDLQSVPLDPPERTAAQWRKYRVRAEQVDDSLATLRPVSVSPSDDPIPEFPQARVVTGDCGIRAVAMQRLSTAHAGTDDSRSKHTHTCVWLPLFALDWSRLQECFPDAPVDLLPEALLKRSESGTQGGGSVVQSWSWHDAWRPPEQLIFGALAVGYARSGDDDPSAPFDDELLRFCLAQAYRLCQQLHPATLLGTIEFIGHRAAATFVNGTFEMACELDQKHKAVWNFPPPTDTNVVAHRKEKQEATESLPYLRGDAAVDTEEYIGGRAREAIQLAIQLHRSVMAPYRLAHTPVYVEKMARWTLSQTMFAVCQEAQRLSRAAQSLCFQIERDSRTGEISQFMEPICLPRKNRPDPRAKELALCAARDMEPRYSVKPDAGRDGPSLSALPLDIARHLTRSKPLVIVIVLAHSQHLNDMARHTLEGQRAEWTFRLFNDHLHQSDLLYRVTKRLRQDIREGRQTLTSARQPPLEDDVEHGRERPHLRSYIESTLQRAVKTLDATAGWVTVSNHAPVGTPRVVRYWHFPDKEAPVGPLRVPDYSQRARFHNTGSAEASAAGPHRKLIIHHSRPGHEQPSVTATAKEVLALAETACEQHNQKLSARFRDQMEQRGEPWTLFEMPVCTPTIADCLNATFAFVMPGFIPLRKYEQQMFEEVNNSLSESFAHMWTLDVQVAEARHAEQVEVCLDGFAESRTAEDLARALLGGIWKNRAESDPKRRGWGLAEHVVVWFVGPGGDLVAHSARGNLALQYLEEADASVIEVSAHPVLGKQVNRESTSSITLQGEFQLTMTELFSLKGADEDNKLVKIYRKIDNKAWLLSFPLVAGKHRDSGKDKIYGVVDCLMPHPLYASEEFVLAGALRTLVRELSGSIQRYRLDMVRQFSQNLFREIDERRRELDLPGVYRLVVTNVSEIMNSTHCDLFIRGAMGTMELCGTTRGLNSDALSSYWAKANDDSSEIIGRCLANHQSVLAHGSRAAKPDPATQSHLSPRLAALVAQDHGDERLAVPLMMTKGADSQCHGLIYIRGPRKTQEEHRSGRLGTAELLLGQRIAETLVRVVQIVRFDEQTNLIMLRIMHTLGQLLQSLRNEMFPLARLLASGAGYNQEAREARKRVDRAFDSWHGTVTTLGTFLRLGQGRLQCSYRWTNIADLVEQSVSMMSALSHLRGNRIDYSSARKQIRLPVDESLMHNAIVNLLDNAIKYSWAREPIQIGTSEENGKIRIWVSNQGIGIPLLHRDSIFEPYFHSNVPDAHGVRAGMGIGLALVNVAIERAHNGTIAVESVPLDGRAPGTDIESVKNRKYETTFTIILSRDQLESEAPPDPATEETR